MRMWRLALLTVVLVASLVAAIHGMPGGYFWTGLAALGLAGEFYAGHLKRTGKKTTLGLRIYSVLFSIALFAAATVFTILAVTSPARERGGFIGLAVIWFAMALGAGLLVVAIERRIRKAEREPPAGHPTTTER